MGRAFSPQGQQLNKINREATPSFSPSYDTYHPCSLLFATAYLNRTDVQKALHVNRELSSTDWTYCSDFVNFFYNYTDFSTSVIPLYEELVTKGMANFHNLNMLIFSGDDDSVCPSSSTQEWIWKLTMNGKDGKTWIPWTVDNQTAGYLTIFDLGKKAKAKFAYTTVHGAGHEVPAYRPKEALHMFQKYLNGYW